MLKWVDPEIIKPDPNIKYNCIYCTFLEQTKRPYCGYIERGLHWFGYKVHTNVGYQRVIAYEK